MGTNAFTVIFSGDGDDDVDIKLAPHVRISEEPSLCCRPTFG